MTKAQSYEILGVAKDADEKAIKKAYFKLVKKFSPEKEPEKFKEIRAAYEYLTQEHPEQDLLEDANLPENSPERKVAELICEALDRESYKEALELAERFAPILDNVIFQYLLYIAQSKNGKTGKAVKTIENLVQMHPENVNYKKELAYAYNARSYHKKALQIFRELYQDGERDLAFLANYVIALNPGDVSGIERSMLATIVEKCKSNLDTYVNVGLNALAMLFMVNNTQEQMEEYQHRAYAYFQKALSDTDELDLHSFEMLVSAMALRYLQSQLGDYETIVKIVTLANNRIKDKEISSIIGDMLFTLQITKFKKDERFSDLLQELVEEYIHDPDTDDPVELYCMDVKLRMLEEWDQHKEEVLTFKKEYPEVYDGVKEGLEDLIAADDLDALREQLLKKYNRLARGWEQTPYYILYPQYKQKEGKLQWDSDEAGSYRRKEKKIGRNDPCPCGSGKKYKNCCGRGK